MPVYRGRDINDYEYGEVRLRQLAAHLVFGFFLLVALGIVYRLWKEYPVEAIGVGLSISLGAWFGAYRPWRRKKREDA